MTFLDTVDGKLARVTMQSSKIGHAMDHGLDIVHPPVWYWCWALGLDINQIELLGQTWSIEIILWCMFSAYVGGRIFEGLFQLLFDDISIFCWKPLDSYHRLITARRNPCMILLSVALVLADATQGFIWVVAWTVISTAFLALRFTYALLVRVVNGPLTSWIAYSNPSHISPSISTKLFTGYPAIKTIKSISNYIE
jgi:phosphatidylglycerophosphate synthase